MSETRIARTSRIPMADTLELGSDQQAVLDAIVNGKRGKIVGPLRVALYSPEMADRWQKLGEFLRYNTSLSEKISELAVIATAAHWRSQVEWCIHSEIALSAGVSETVIEAIRNGESPEFADQLDFLVYEYTRESLSFGDVSNDIYTALLGLLDESGIVELTGIIGYYSMVAMTLNIHQVPLPEGSPRYPLNQVAAAGETLKGLPLSRYVKSVGS